MGAAGSDGEAPPPAESFRAVYEILVANCGTTACHGDGAAAHPRYASSDPSVSEAAARADANELLDRVLRDADDPLVMPKVGTPLSDAELATIEAWIAAL
jgi:cytochrome c553